MILFYLLQIVVFLGAIWVGFLFGINYEASRLREGGTPRPRR